ncbi:UBX domain-containing protein 2A [Bufo bufo]|uniref:UBX domain-containing protein 2A n=1 Tax=Bufo bufo TaxID=8384 RepID=UPI001ABE0AB7|nr:UBX domain-containing protein 2A [Bufo bufo]
MREADKTDAMKPQDRVFGMVGRRRSSERKRCDSFVNSLFEEAEDAGVPNASPEDETEVVIKMWKNGFTINDGQLRDYTDAANRQFMDSMRKRELPPELHKTFAKKELSVNVEDRKSEEYWISKKRVDPFSGQGHRLGSATPKVITKAADGLENGDEQSLPTVELNAGEPLTNVKIWLADGKRIIQKFNTTHRISDVKNFVERIPCKSEKTPFTLATSFPLRDLLDETVTIQEARLQNSVLVQRLQKTTETFRNS